MILLINIPYGKMEAGGHLTIETCLQQIQLRRRRFTISSNRHRTLNASYEKAVSNSS